MKKPLLILAISAAFASSAGAAVQSVDAGNYTFSYDDSFWGLASGTVFGQSGNTFTFSQLGYSASATGLRRGENASEFADWANGGALSIQAKSGYQIQSIVSGAVGSIATTMGGSAGAYASVEANTFSQWNNSEGFSSDTTIFSEKTGSGSLGAANGSYQVSGITHFGGVQRADLTYYQTSGSATVAGLGSSASATHDGAYFTVQVSAVPEPDTSAMFLAGLGVIGLLVRRRSRTM
jgi:hypothetical protein